MKIVSIISLIFLLSLGGCSKMKASPAPDSGFLEHTEQMTEQRERFPFNRVWISPEFKTRRDLYTHVIIAPVNTSHLMQMDWWQKQSAVTKAGLQKDAQEIADYTLQTFEKAFSKDPKHRFIVTKTPGPNTFKIEVAIVELVPSKAFLNAASTVGGFFVPGAGLAASAGKGSIAIEARVTDSTTGELIGQIADREEAKSAMVDVAGLSWYESNKNSIDDWADQFVELANSDPSKKVSDSSPFALVTW